MQTDKQGEKYFQGYHAKYLLKLPVRLHVKRPNSTFYHKPPLGQADPDMYMYIKSDSFNQYMVGSNHMDPGRYRLMNILLDEFGELQISRRYDEEEEAKRCFEPVLLHIASGLPLDTVTGTNEPLVVVESETSCTVNLDMLGSQTGEGGQI